MSTLPSYSFTNPSTYLIRISVFLLIVLCIIFFIFADLERAIASNLALNISIIGIFIISVILSYSYIIKVTPELNWLDKLIGSNNIPKTIENLKSPLLLTPFRILIENQDPFLSFDNPSSNQSALDMVASRLKEERDILKYLTGLLVFIGLLGTFWGLTKTVGSISDTIQSLNFNGQNALNLFADLKNGLTKPLEGMGTAFSSSLLGLSTSLIVGFLALQVNQLHQRVLSEIEDWLLSQENNIPATNDFKPISDTYSMSHLIYSIGKLNETVIKIEKIRSTENKEQHTELIKCLIAQQQNSKEPKDKI